MSFKQQVGQSLIWRGLYFVTVLVMNIFLARFFQAGGAGWIFYLSNNFALMVVLAGWTMENSVNYYSAKRGMEDNQLAWFSIAWSGLVAIIVFVCLAVFFAFDNNASAINHRDYIFYAICYIAGTQLTNFFSALFYANKNFFLPNLVMILLNLVIIGIVWSQDTNRYTHRIITIYFVFFLLTGLALAVAFAIYKQSWKRISLPSVANIRLLARYALMALAANVIFFLVYRVDYWFVKQYCSLQELGNYIQVSKLGQMLLIIPTIISSVVFPNTAAGDAAPVRMQQNIMRIGKMTVALYLGFFLGTAAFGRWAFPFIFGPTFRLMYLPFLLLVPGICALSNLYLLSAYFSGINRVKVNVVGAVLALLVILAGDFLLIPRYGIAAAAAVSTIGYSVNFGYSYLVFKKQYRLQINTGSLL
jgi:O-antigen/teichoic acid export membrane protein